MSTMEEIKTALERADGWENLLTGFGQASKDHRMSSRFKRRRVIERAEYEAMWEEDWVFARMVELVPKHCVRKWVRVIVDDDTMEEDAGKDMLDSLSDLSAQQRFYDLMKWDRLDGGAAMLIGADDGQEIDRPLNLDRVRGVRHLNVLRRHEIIPGEINDDPASENFRNPEFYQIAPSTTARGASIESSSIRKIHHSRVIRMVSIQPSEFSVYGLNGWGLPLASRVYDEVRQFGQLWGYIEAMFKDISQGVMRIGGLAEALSTTKGNEALTARMQMLAMAASVFNMVLIDKEETYERRSLNFGGLSDVVTRVMEKVSGAAEVPVTIFFGQTPSGLSTDDASGKRNFYDSIANEQRRLLRSPLMYLVEILFHSTDGPTGGRVPESWKLEFVPLEEENAKERAETRKTEAETDIALVDAGIITEQEARSRYLNDGESPYQLDESLDLMAEEVNQPVPNAEAMLTAMGQDIRPQEEQQIEEVPNAEEPGAGDQPR